MPWYKQTAIWGLIISTFALTLSQMPPIGRWLAVNKLSTTVGSRIGLPNTLGVQGVQLFLDISNTGNRTLNISKIRLEVKGPNSSTLEVKAQTYAKILSGQAQPIDFPITSVSLNPGANWSELVSFYPDFTPTQEEKINSIRLRVSQSIFAKQQARGGQFGPLVEAEELLVQEAKQFFNNNFNLEKGSYTVMVKCESNGIETLLKTMSFTLYDYHLVTLKSQADDFKYGAGIFFPTNQPKQIWALNEVQ